MSKSVEMLRLPEQRRANVEEEEERTINPTVPSNLQQYRCNFGTGYGEDVQQRYESANKLFPGIQNVQQTHSLLGRSGVRLSKICLGTLNFGKINEEYGSRPGQLNEKQAHQILNRYVELGGNCIDTGNFYPWFGCSADQLSETIIGNWLQK